MKSDKEIAQEALRRAKNVDKRRAEKTRRIYGISSVATCLTLIIALSFAFPSVDGGAAATEGLHGASLFADGSVGGYALIGVIGFILGAAVVIFYKRNKD